MKDISLAAEQREGRGKGAAHQLRGTGRIPAVMYGPETKPTPLTIEERAFRTALKQAGGQSTLFTLTIGGKQSKVILREIQRDPVSNRVLHLDFHAISMNRPIHINIPVHFTGIAKGVKAEGGIMQVVMREIEISCLPTNIPEHVEVDVSELGIGDSIHLGALVIPNATILGESTRTVVVISAPTIIKVETPAVPAEGEAAVVAEGEAAPGAEGAAKEGAAPAAGKGAPAAGKAAPGAAGKAAPAAGDKGKKEDKK
ncbi:MAG: 50S ribosomal protein L25/general stress protein Ctc [candidate division Zixibacteria bacterium]|nr:50S ribosomal protein L25/general stress protein Ctc [candidate division Zixibacteria bacterium]